MSTPAAKIFADAKVKRQRKILAVLSVVMLALLGFELPKMLGGSGAQTGAPPVVTDVSSVPGAPGVPGAPVAGAPGELPDTDRVAIEPGSGQLISFGLFKSKDPFVQQLSALGSVPPSSTEPALTTSDPTGTPTTSVTTPGGPAPPLVIPRRTAPNGGLTPVTTTTPSLTPASTVPFPSTTTATPGVPTPGRPATPPVAPTSVAISTNGVCESLGVTGTFPGTEDIFRLISIAKDGKSVKIGVVGGAYDSGESAVTLKLGEKLTLVNTADGTRYLLLLKARCDFETQPVSGGTTTGTSTAAAPTTTTTATTPIVTDAFDTTTPGG